MIHWLRELDEALRGRKADPRLLAEGTAHIHIQPLVVVSVAMGMIYGVCMGLYAVATRTPPSFAQLVTSAVKVPALFFLTLAVTFPSLYVFSAVGRAAGAEGHIPAYPRPDCHQPGRARVPRPDHRVLHAQHDQLPFHEAPERVLLHGRRHHRAQGPAGHAFQP